MLGLSCPDVNGNYPYLVQHGKSPGTIPKQGNPSWGALCGKSHVTVRLGGNLY